jgi:hypothetical protein
VANVVDIDERSSQPLEAHGIGGMLAAGRRPAGLATDWESLVNLGLAEVNAIIDAFTSICVNFAKASGVGRIERSCTGRSRFQPGVPDPFKHRTNGKAVLDLLVSLAEV